MFEDDASVFAAMRAGARGYLLKGAEQEEIVRAIRAVAAGEAIFGSEIAQRIIEYFTADAGTTRAAFPTLTDRERDVLVLIAAGQGNAAIAEDLSLSLKTVRNHVSSNLHQGDGRSATVRPQSCGRARPGWGLVRRPPDEPPAPRTPRWAVGRHG